jgi:hypothetical protein
MGEMMYINVLVGMLMRDENCANWKFDRWNEKATAVSIMHCFEL